MPKADKGTTGKSPGKQEVDAETRAVTSLAEAMERHKLAGENAGGTCPTPPDAERHPWRTICYLRRSGETQRI